MEDVMAEKLWESYEDAFRAILERHKEFFGLDAVEPGPGKVPSESGYVYNVEVIGYAKGDHKAVLFECRRRTTRNLEPKDAGEFAYRIESTGAKKGYFVTPLEHGLSGGAKTISAYEQIGHIQLSECATPHDYVMRFLDQVFAGISNQIAMKSEFRCAVYDKHGKLLREG